MATARFRRIGRGQRAITLGSITYTATHYPSGGPGTRAYWTVQMDPPPAPGHYDSGNDWYADSWAIARMQILDDAAKRAAVQS